MSASANQFNFATTTMTGVTEAQHTNAPLVDTAGVRYAIYFAPESGSPLDDLGSHWLGRDAVIDMPLPQPEVPGLSSEQLRALTAAPRHYGLHGTLKAPFRLREGQRYEALEMAAMALATTLRRFNIALSLHERDGFIALRAVYGDTELSQLSWECVRRLDAFRQPFSEQELERRGAGLTSRQRQLLAQWGYAYVSEQFRFHLTLCARANREEVVVLQPFLENHFAPVCGKPIGIDSLCIFEERNGTPMKLKARFRLEGL